MPEARLSQARFHGAHANQLGVLIEGAGVDCPDRQRVQWIVFVHHESAMMREGAPDLLQKAHMMCLVDMVKDTSCQYEIDATVCKR